jgi:hypothetical protein
MKATRVHLILVLAIVCVFGSLSRSVEYRVYTGVTDADYEVTKFGLWGLIDALDGLGLSSRGLWWSQPYHFWEDSTVWWDSGYPYDDGWADETCVTILDGYSGTYRDGNNWYFLIETKGEWSGVKHVSNLEEYGAPLRLGETKWWLPNDDSTEGSCRYLIVLGSNTVAIGPAYVSSGYPNYPRPDLFDRDNAYHANPFEIWDRPMTNGLRMVMGFTGHSYGSTGDRDDWGRFEYYHDHGFSIAESFAKAALDADSRHIPVVLVQGASDAECLTTLAEQTFKTSRPGGHLHKRYCYWYREPLSPNARRNFGIAALSQDTAPSQPALMPLNHAAHVCESTDSKRLETEFASRYLALVGLEETTPQYKMRAHRTVYQSTDENEAHVDHRQGSFLYHNPRAYLEKEDGAELTREECVETARALLEAYDIVTAQEVELTDVISVREVVAANAEAAAVGASPGPSVLAYTAVFKRKVGELSIVSNDVDTIRVEITTNGQIASLISNYKHGRVLTEGDPVRPYFADSAQAFEALAAMGPINEIKAGLLPEEDGTYVPVYKVTTSPCESSAGSAYAVHFLRQDTLAPVSVRSEQAVDGYEVNDLEAQE